MEATMTAQKRHILLGNLGSDYLRYIDEHVRQPGESDVRLIDRLIRNSHPEHVEAGLVPEVSRHGERLSVFQPSKEFQRRIDYAIGHPSSLARIDTVWVIRECPEARVADVIATVESWGYPDDVRAIIGSLVRRGVVERFTDTGKPRVRLTLEFAEKLSTPL